MTMYITDVEIWNFQSHAYTKVSLVMGINALIGTSNSGKSGFFRAVKWNLTNSPAGSEFIKIGEKEAKVVVTWSDGHQVERCRNKSGTKNTYALYKDGELIEEYTGFGSNVPPLIQETTKVDPKDVFNFANQLESAFLISDSPKVRAERVGNLEELGRIDAELQKVNDDIRFETKLQKETAKKIVELEKEIKRMSKENEKKKPKVDTLRVLKEGIQEKQRLVRSMERVKERLGVLQEEKDGLSKQIHASQRILEQWDEGLVDKVAETKRLMQITNRLQEIKLELEDIHFLSDEVMERLLLLNQQTSASIDSYQRLSVVKERAQEAKEERDVIRKSVSEKVAALSYDSIDKDVETYRALFKQHKRLTDIQTEKMETKEQIERASMEIDDLLNRFVEALHQYDVCPTCAQSVETVNEKTIEQII